MLTTAALVASITVFVLAIFLGFELISKVPPTLHTPLMSGANAISGITIVGALILSNVEFNNGNPGAASWLAFIALVLSLIHISEPTRLRRTSYAVFCLKKTSPPWGGWCHRGRSAALRAQASRHIRRRAVAAARTPAASPSFACSC